MAHSCLSGVHEELGSAVMLDLSLYVLVVRGLLSPFGPLLRISPRVLFSRAGGLPTWQVRDQQSLNKEAVRTSYGPGPELAESCQHFIRAKTRPFQIQCGRGPPPKGGVAHQGSSLESSCWQMLAGCYWLWRNHRSLGQGQCMTPSHDCPRPGPQPHCPTCLELHTTQVRSTLVTLSIENISSIACLRIP